MPAGYDQVITVGAITDYDGAGWGDASDGCSGEGDDSYARYSNYGADVDILAPGTCVRVAAALGQRATSPQRHDRAPPWPRPT